MSTLQNNEIVTGECKLSYVTLLEPRTISEKNAPSFSVKILIPKTDEVTKTALGKARDVARQNGVTEGKKPFQGFSAERLASMNISIKDGDKDFPDNPECKGHLVINAKTPQDKPPGVMVLKEGVPTRQFNPTDIYSGMYGKVHVQLYPYNTAGNQGIGISLQNVLKTKDGDPLGGTRKRAEDVFGGGDSPFEESAAPAAGGSPI